MNAASDALNVESSDSEDQIKEAQAQGWQADYDGDNKKTAAEFIHDGRFFKQINELKTQNSSLQKSFEQMKGHYEKVRVSDLKKAEADYSEKIDSLKAEKVTALDEGDNHRVVEIDEQIRTAVKPVDEPVVGNPEFDSWIDDNKWYETSTFLQIEADKVGEFYYGKGLRGKELYNAIGDHVQELHPDKFTNQKRNKPAAVEGDTPRSAKPTNGKVSEKDLTANEREVFRNFKANGVFKNDEDVQTYFRQVMEIR